MGVPECTGCRALQERIARLEARLLELEARLRDREDAAKPPPVSRATEPIPPAPDKKPTGRKPGGQPGHKHHRREIVPPERVNKFEKFIPTACQGCGTELPTEAGPDDPAPIIHQVFELPEISATVTEYQAHSRKCQCCGTVTAASFADHVPARCFGDELTASLTYLSGRHGMSKRGIAELCQTLFRIPISLGSITELERETSQALVPAYQEVKAAVEEAAVKHLDETGWREQGRKRWLWAARIVNAVLFMIHARRNADALSLLVGESMKGVLVSDRMKTYERWDPDRRQLCWAHLRRNWEVLAEKIAAAKGLETRFAAACHKMFEMWHVYRKAGVDTKESRQVLSDRMIPIEQEFSTILHEGAASDNRKLAGFCARVIACWPMYWTFVEIQGVEPTNNNAERVLRPGVLWRRKSFGCQSAEGCRFVERVLTVTQTAAMQKLNVFEFLVKSVKAHRKRLPAPKLLTTG